MTDTPPLFDFSHLTVAERIELAMKLWDSVIPHADQVPITDAQKQELDRRIAYDAGEMTPGSRGRKSSSGYSTSQTTNHRKMAKDQRHRQRSRRQPPSGDGKL